MAKNEVWRIFVMDDILAKLMNNPYAWFALSLLAILGVVLTIIFAIKGKKVRKISQYRSTYKIIRNINSELNDLEIKWKDDLIDNLSITKMTIWNDGNIKLEEDDFASSEHLAIEAIKDCKMLNASILLAPEKTNTFNIDLILELNKMFINFEYMDAKDGVVIQIVHTGSANNLRLVGKIKSGKAIKNEDNNNDKPLSKNVKQIAEFFNHHMLIIMVIVVILVIIIFGALIYFTSSSTKELVTNVLIVFFAGISVFLRERASAKDNKVPKKLRS
jgi:hypothetical protein